MLESTDEDSVLADPSDRAISRQALEAFLNWKAHGAQSLPARTCYEQVAICSGRIDPRRLLQSCLYDARNCYLLVS